jgi:hypothetical protein
MLQALDSFKLSLCELGFIVVTVKMLSHRTALDSKGCEFSLRFEYIFVFIIVLT